MIDLEAIRQDPNIVCKTFRETFSFADIVTIILDLDVSTFASERQLWPSQDVRASIHMLHSAAAEYFRASSGCIRYSGCL